MAALSSVDFSTGVLSSGTTGTVRTINAVSDVAGTPAAFAMTVQKSTAVFTVTLSSAASVTPSSAVTITPSSAVSVTPSSALTVFVSSLTGGTVTSLSSGLVAIANGANTAAVKASVTAAASTDPALVVAISPNNSITVASAANSIFKITTIDGTNSTNIKAASATLYGAQLYNNGSSAIFLKLYNLSSAPTAGSSLFMLNIGVAPGAPLNMRFAGVHSSIGLGYTITGAVASTDTTVVSSNDLIGSIEYV